MFRTIIASIAMYSVITFSLGFAAFTPANAAESNITEVKSCATCSAAAQTSPLDKLATLGRRTQNIELLPIARSQNNGFPVEFVSSSTGELAFAQTDLAFADNPLLLFQRTYVSSRNEDFGLGNGWSYVFNDSITLNDETAVLTTGAGGNFTYQRNDAKHYVLQPSDTTDVKEFNVENGNTITAKNGDITKIYKRTGGKYFLTEIIAPGGFEVTLNRSSKGRLSSISSLSGEINLDWSSGSDAKLLAVTDNTGRRVAFSQSNDLLQSATNAVSGKWQYEYTGEKISKVIDPANKISLRAKYNANGRASEVGDAVGLNHFAYEINKNNVSTRTTITDSLNYARTFQHTERGILTDVKDADGTLLSIQYNADNQPVQVTGADGTTVIFVYDAQNRLTRQTTADGGEKVFEYAANGKLKAIIENGERTDIVYDNETLTENRIRKNGKSVKSTYNRRGQEIHLQVEDGIAVDFEYDAKGRKTAVVYSDTGRFETTFDAAGRKTSEKLPSGLITSYEYNADNQIVRKSDNRGHSARAERDASGNLMKVINADDNWVKIFRDEAGRIVQLTNALGQSRHYSYNSRGALTEFIGADGRDLQFQYNKRGELQSVINTETGNLIYRRNQSGSLAKIQQITSQKNIWQMQKINYTSKFINSTIDDSCLFGDGFSIDDFFDAIFFDAASTAFVGGVGCNNPYGGDGGGSYGGGSYGGGGETCYQCRQRETNNCQSTYEASLQSNTGVGLLGAAACAGLTAGIGLAACVTLAAAGVASLNSSSATTRDNCLRNAASQCSSICNR